MAVITVSTKGQIIIPSDIRKKYNIKQGDRLEIQEMENKLVLVPLHDSKPFVRLFGKLRGKSSLIQSLQSEHALEIEKEEC